MVTKILADAVTKAASLPASDQERIRRELDRYVESLAALREKLDQGIRSLDAGFGKYVDMEELIARANAGHAER